MEDNQTNAQILGVPPMPDTPHVELSILGDSPNHKPPKIPHSFRLKHNTKEYFVYMREKYDETYDILLYKMMELYDINYLLVEKFDNIYEDEYNEFEKYYKENIDEEMSYSVIKAEYFNTLVIKGNQLTAKVIELENELSKKAELESQLSKTKEENKALESRIKEFEQYNIVELLKRIEALENIVNQYRYNGYLHQHGYDGNIQYNTNPGAVEPTLLTNIYQSNTPATTPNE